MPLYIDPRTVISVPTPNTLRENKNNPEIIKERCKDFEAIYLQSMFKAMRKTVPDGGLFEKNSAEEMYQDMLDTELATQTARHQSFGLAEKMYEQIERNLKNRTSR
ncbi:MAG: rod-binding protein [Desulfobulbaceae bacterium]|nr:rod-binding protein [Desulfobulbaceae bacterium]